MAYNYLENMVADIRAILEDNDSAWITNGICQCEDRNDLYERLNDELWDYDEVTGNASGSYTFDRQCAKGYVMDGDNLDLLRDACAEFDCKAEFADRFFNGNWEWMDVTIRCYLLGQAIDKALDEMEQEEKLAYTIPLF